MAVRRPAMMLALLIPAMIAGGAPLSGQGTPPTAPRGVRLADQSAPPLAAAPLNTPLPLDPKVTSGRFANGLRYLIRVNKEPANRAELRLAVDAGSILEDDDQLGLAHVVEHMAFNGTRNFPKQELVRFLESTGMRFGPSVNAFTSFDETVYMLQVPTDKADLLANRQGARRHHRGVADPPGRGRADPEAAAAGPAERLALRRAAADRQARDHQDLRA